MTKSTGFSLTEVMVALAIISVLTSVGGFIYISYLNSAKHSALVQTVKNVETEVKFEVDHILRGGTAATQSVDDGEAITGEATCDKYVRSLAKKYRHLKNPYDGSPMITLWDGWRTFQKRGKDRITCSREPRSAGHTAHSASPASGSTPILPIVAVTVNRATAPFATRIAAAPTGTPEPSSRNMKRTSCTGLCCRHWGRTYSTGRACNAIAVPH